MTVTTKQVPVQQTQWITCIDLTAEERLSLIAALQTLWEKDFLLPGGSLAFFTNQLLIKLEVNPCPLGS